LSAISISFLALFGIQMPSMAMTRSICRAAGLVFAFGAILRVNLAVLQRHGDALERQRFAVGIEAHGHDVQAPRPASTKYRAEPAVLAPAERAHRPACDAHRWKPVCWNLLCGVREPRRYAALHEVDRLLRRDRIEIAVAHAAMTSAHRRRRACRSTDDPRLPATQSSWDAWRDKYAVALSMPTCRPVGECMISSALVQLCQLRHQMARNVLDDIAAI